VAESGSADRLAQLVRRTHPDVVLLDARLPGVGGAEACQQLTTANPDLAVLMVSSYSADRLVEECINAALTVRQGLRELPKHDRPLVARLVA
jgi:DNA-binding NarL/FixJ family response regulator